MSKQRFSELMDDLGLIYDRDVTTALKRLYWDDLGHLPIEMIEASMRAHRCDSDRGRFFPKPADLVAQLESASPQKRLTADEAWALALDAMDETATVCATNEILEAVAAATPIWEIGDKVGARMAFKAAYDRITAERRLRGQLPEWRLSLGWDAEKRAPAAQDAIRLGRMTREQVQAYLPAPEPHGAAHAVAGLLTGKVVEFPVGEDAKSRAQFKRLRDAIAEGTGKTPKQDAGESRIAFEQRKREALAALDRMQQEHGT